MNDFPKIIYLTCLKRPEWNEQVRIVSTAQSINVCIDSIKGVLDLHDCYYVDSTFSIMRIEPNSNGSSQFEDITDLILDQIALKVLDEATSGIVQESYSPLWTGYREIWRQIYLSGYNNGYKGRYT